MNILRLNIDALRYIGVFLPDPSEFYYLIPHKKDLYKSFNSYDFSRYIDYLLVHKYFEEFKQITKYVILGGTRRIKFVIKHYDECIFNFCLKKIKKNIDYFDLFKCAFHHNNINAIKQLMKYENICELIDVKIFLEFTIIYYRKYRKSIKNGCSINMEMFKYYISHTINKKFYKKSLLMKFNSIYLKLIHHDRIINSRSIEVWKDNYNAYKAYIYQKNEFKFYTKIFVRDYLFHKDIFHIETSRFKHIFKKNDIDDELTNHFNFDFTFGDVNFIMVNRPPPPTFGTGVLYDFHR